MVTWKDKLNIRLGIFLLLLGTSSLLTLGFTHSNFIHSSASLNYLKFNNSCLIYKDQYLYLGKKTFLNDVEKKIFNNRISTRLPKYIDLFKKYSQDNFLTWYLLAAISYQESHWNHKAISPTQVKGLMMITFDTMNFIGIKNRLDPEQSVHGASKYLKNIYGRLPSSIKGPDRLWMTIAAYNVGLGHLEDARKLTQRFGGNPNNWSNVSKYLPLLSKKKYYQSLKHGYARGYEPVIYVKRIQAYLEILRLKDRSVIASFYKKFF